MPENLDHPNSSQEVSFAKNSVINTVSEKKEEIKVKTVKEVLEDTLDSQCYLIGEVPQSYLLDPEIMLPINSDHLNTEKNLQVLIDETNYLIQEEINEIQKHQKSVDYWEERIKKSKALIKHNYDLAKKNNESIAYDKRNRDYWWERAEQVELDYQNTEVASREDEWAWLIKKYGLKNPDGTAVNSKNIAVEELCNGGCKNLSVRYRSTGDRYEEKKRERERENTQFAKENAKNKSTIETLQRYVNSAYECQIEPLQTGILLMKELTAKLKAYTTQDSNATYGDLREWGELYLNEFLKEHSQIKQSVVTDFRRIASIPLPPENC
jgi:hypothetical protein